MSDVLDHLATFAEPVLLTGDVNIRLERSTDSDTGRFVDMLTARGLARITTDPTHRLGVALDVVATRADIVPSRVDVIDVGVSDHALVNAVNDVVGSTVSSLHVEDWSIMVTSGRCRFPCCLTVVATLSPRVLVHTRRG